MALLAVKLLALSSDPQDDHYLMPAGAQIGYCSSSLDKMIITGSYLYIWVERGTVKENCLFQDDIETP